MKRHIALLRGINVGKAKRVPMADLRALMASLGHANVRTLLNSGNAVFDAKAGTPAGHAKKLRAAILAQLGVDCEVIVKTADELAAAIAELKPLEAEDWAPEAFAAGGHAAWLWCAGGIIESRVAKAVGKVLKERGTARNWATVEKLQALVEADAGA